MEGRVTCGGACDLQRGRGASDLQRDHFLALVEGQDLLLIKLQPSVSHHHEADEAAS